MKIEDRIWESPHIGRAVTLRVYGAAGKAVLVFPPQSGRYWDFENFGMVKTCAASIEGGKIQLFCVDSVDAESWANWNAHPADRALRHEDYDRYIMKEVVPFINARAEGAAKIFTTGCSMGGYHAANFFFRHPDIFDTMVSLSGVMDLRLFVGDYVDNNVYFNAPLRYLKNLTDEHYLKLYRQSKIIVCVGRGAWDEQMLADARALEAILKEKQVQAWIDYWGPDVSHDWPWWQKQWPYFLGRLGY